MPDQTIKVLLVAHVFVKGDKREDTIQALHKRERTEAEYSARDNNWKLSLYVDLPYHPQAGTRITLPFIAQGSDSFSMLMENAQRAGIPRVRRLFVVDSVTFWLPDGVGDAKGIDHAVCEIEAEDRTAAWNQVQQLKEGFGFVAWPQ